MPAPSCARARSVGTARPLRRRRRDRRGHGRCLLQVGVQGAARTFEIQANWYGRPGRGHGRQPGRDAARRFTDARPRFEEATQWLQARLAEPRAAPEADVALLLELALAAIFVRQVVASYAGEDPLGARAGPPDSEIVTDGERRSERVECVETRLLRHRLSLTVAEVAGNAVLDAPALAILEVDLGRAAAED